MSFVRYIGRIKTPAPSIESERNPKYIMGKEKKDMPLIKGKKAKTQEGISKNIEIEKHAHPDMPIKQAAAIAYSTARESHSKSSHSKKNHRHKEHR